MTEDQPERLAQLVRDWLSRNGADSDDGWTDIDTVRRGLSDDLQVEVRHEQIVQLATDGDRLEVEGALIRTVRARPVLIPDILFHATTAHGLERAVRTGSLSFGGGRRLFLSSDEGAAWRAAHRLDGPPRLLVVDAARARRGATRFGRTRVPDLYTASHVPLRHVLNLRHGYAEQWSAGGLPVRVFPDGVLRVALVQVVRRSGATWEIAKGKLEPGESPEAAAMREVREEMGLAAALRVLRHVGDVRYGFTAPGDLPRLKTIFFYLMEVEGSLTAFAPRAEEGIAQVGWFGVDEAVRAVTHSSLIPVMARARDLLLRYGASPAAPSDASAAP